MRTLEIGKLRYFKWRIGLGVILPILVIASVVKGITFEGESNHLRQALRQQEQLISRIKKDLKLKENVEVDSVFPSRNLPKDSSSEVESFEKSQSIVEEFFKWRIKNPDKAVQFFAIVGSTALLEGEVAISNGDFKPVGGLIFFVKME